MVAARVEEGFSYTGVGRAHCGLQHLRRYGLRPLLHEGAGQVGELLRAGLEAEAYVVPGRPPITIAQQRVSAVSEGKQRGREREREQRSTTTAPLVEAVS